MFSKSVLIQQTLSQFSVRNARLHRQARNHPQEEDDTEFLTTMLIDDDIGAESNTLGADDILTNPPVLTQKQLKKYQKWANRQECLHLDDQSSYIVSPSGIVCRICHRHQNSISKSRDKYVSVPAQPTHVNSVLDHMKTKTHSRAVRLWLQDQERIQQSRDVDMMDGRRKQKQNQIRAVNYIAHRHASVNDFKTLTNTLNSVDNSFFVTDSSQSEYKLFWDLADRIDRFYQRPLLSSIRGLIPISLMLDLSTDNTSTSMFCVNLRFLDESKRPKTILLGLAEMNEGSTGLQIYHEFKKMLVGTGLTVSQIASVATDGDASMTGIHHGFITELRHDNPLILHSHCDVHKLQLSLKDTFQKDPKSITAIIIHNAALFIHQITKSHTNKKKFAAELERRQLPVRKLAKPIQVRWSTCTNTCTQAFKYSDVIMSVLQPTTDPKILSLLQFFSNPENLLRLAALEILLDIAEETNVRLQTDNLHVFQTSARITELQEKLSDLTNTSIPTKLQSVIAESGKEHLEPFIESV